MKDDGLAEKVLALAAAIRDGKSHHLLVPMVEELIYLVVVKKSADNT